MAFIASTLLQDSAVSKIKTGAQAVNVPTVPQPYRQHASSIRDGITAQASLTKAVHCTQRTQPSWSIASASRASCREGHQEALTSRRKTRRSLAAHLSDLVQWSEAQELKAGQEDL